MLLEMSAMIEPIVSRVFFAAWSSLIETTDRTQPRIVHNLLRSHL